MKRNNGFDVFENLPQEITINIISRLPYGSIIRSKLASKAFRDAVKSRNFPRLHCSKHEHEHDTVFVCMELSRNVVHDPEHGHVLVNHTGSHSFKIVDLMKNGTTTITPVPLPPFHTLAEHKPLPCCSSAEGLIVLWWPCSQALSVCNPVTREYVRVAIPDEINPARYGRLADIRFPVTLRRRVERDDVNYGFGLSRKSKQFKLVWIVQGQKCQVHTLGTGHWRVGRSPPKIAVKQNCAFVSGKLHWLQHWERVCSFDLESEVFTSFSAPPRPNGFRRLCVLEECLCVCDCDEDGMRMWIMRVEGDWSVQFVIPKNMVVRDMKRSLPIKVLGNDMILMEAREERYCYDNNTKTTRVCHGFGSFHQDSIACHFKPSFVSLKTFIEHKEFIYSF